MWKSADLWPREFLSVRHSEEIERFNRNGSPPGCLLENYPDRARPRMIGFGALSEGDRGTFPSAVDNLLQRVFRVMASRDYRPRQNTVDEAWVRSESWSKMFPGNCAPLRLLRPTTSDHGGERIWKVSPVPFTTAP